MQETLTLEKSVYAKYFFKTKKKKFSFFVLILFIIITVLFINVIVVNNENSKNYYFLSLNNTTNKSMLKQIQSEADDVVGASYIYKINNTYHVLGFIYESINDAKTNLSEVKQFLPKSQILIFRNKSLKKRVNNQLKTDAKLKSIYKEICNVKTKILNVCKKLKNNQTDMSVFRELTIIELNLNENLNYLSNLKETKLVSLIKTSNAVTLSLIKNVKDEIVKSISLLENLKILYMKVVLEEINLKNSLNML